MSFVRKSLPEKGLKLIYVIMLAACLSPFINQIAEKFLPNQEVSITVHDSSSASNIYILDDGFCELFQKEKLDGILSEKEWMFLGKEDGFSYDMIYTGGDLSGKVYSFQIKAQPNAKLTFWANLYGSQITVQSKNMRKEIDLYSEIKGGEIKTYYPFEDSNTLFIIKGLLFFTSVIIVYVLLVVVDYLVRRRALPPILEKEPNWKLILVLFFAFYVLDIILYKNNLIPNLLKLGDQITYWVALWNGAAGELSSAHEYIRVWNGYLCFYVPYICRLIGQTLGVDQLLIWFIVPSASAAIMIGYSVPQIYTFCTKRQAKVWQSLLFALIYVCFWSGTLSAVLMDLIGISTLLLAVAMMMRFVTVSKPLYRIIYATMAGLMFSASISFRTVNLFSIPFLILLVLVIYIRENHTNRKWNRLKIATPGLISLLLAFGLVCIPQTIINRNIGTSSLFPCANREIWHSGIYDRSLKEYSMNVTFEEVFSGYPFPNGDSHAESIKKYEYNSEPILTMSQELDLLMSQPLDTITYIAKKIFVGFDSKTGITYPDFSLKKDVRFYVFSFFNYFIFASALYALLRKKVDTKSGVLLAILFLSLILPHTWTHVEWRYYLVGYLMAYFLFSYYFFENTRESANSIERAKYWAFVDTVIVFAFLISLDFYSKI